MRDYRELSDAIQTIANDRLEKVALYAGESKDALKRLRFIQSRTMIWKQVGDQIMTMSYHWTAIYMPFIRQTFMMPLIRQIIIKIEYHNRSCWMRFAAYCFRQRRQPGELLPPQQAPAAD